MLSFEKAIDISKKIIESAYFLCQARVKQTYFTRRSKLGFKYLIYFMINFIKNTLQLELNNFYEEILMKDDSITKQAYSKAREKISHKAFVMLTDEVTKACYENNMHKTYKGYRLCAIDGSVIGLNNSKRLRESFGYIENQYTNVAKARAHGLYDIENEYFITTKLAHYRDSEREVAKDLINKMIELGSKNDLILFDRGYQSKHLIEYLENNRVKYIMRTSSQFIKAIKNTQTSDETIIIKLKSQKANVRVVKFELDDGTEETLITNIEDDLSLEEFKQLYFKRWGIEVKFDELKNKLQIENFTGDTKEKVKQDFYASIYLSNMASLAKSDAEKQSKKRLNDKSLKYEYKINNNILIGTLKDFLISAMLEDNPLFRSLMINKVMKKISRNVVPIRPNRKFSRGGVRSYKYPLNKKHNL